MAADHQSARFQPGDVVQLKSGGPMLTVAEHTVTTHADLAVHIIYFNSVTGLFEKFTTDMRCLRGGIGRPELPEDANKLRTTSVAKSSMS